jgi:polyphosphate kinase
MPKEIRNFVKQYFDIRDEEMVEGGRYHNLKDMGGLMNPTGKKLTYDSWPSVSASWFCNASFYF